MSVSVRITEFLGNSIAVTVKFTLKYRIHELNNLCQNHQHIGVYREYWYIVFNVVDLQRNIHLALIMPL